METWQSNKGLHKTTTCRQSMNGYHQESVIVELIKLHVVLARWNKTWLLNIYKCRVSFMVPQWSRGF